MANTFLRTPYARSLEKLSKSLGETKVQKDGDCDFHYEPEAGINHRAWVNKHRAERARFFEKFIRTRDQTLVNDLDVLEAHIKAHEAFL